MAKRKKPEQKLPPGADFAVTIKDFGPISKGTINVKPLTVLVGPNNSGKSYAATVLYALYRADGSFFGKSPSRATEPEVRTAWRTFWEHLRKVPREGAVVLPHDTMEELLRWDLRFRLTHAMSAELQRCFSANLSELPRLGHDRFSLGLVNWYSSSAVVLAENDLEVNTKLWLPEVRVRRQEDGDAIVEFGREEFSFSAERIRQAEGDLLTYSFMLPSVVGKLFSCSYLPAGRSGMIQTYPLIAAQLVEQTPLARAQAVSTPSINGTVADLIAQLLRMSEKRHTPLQELVAEFEDRMSGGEVVVESESSAPFRQIIHRSRSSEMPMHRTSSSTSELAPLFLYLKQVTQRGSTLIVEEPEAHLHPDNQRELAHLLVRLIREGVRIIITTHSEFLIDQLSNFVMLSQVSPEERQDEFKLSADSYLNPDELAVHQFTYDRRTKGHKIDELKVTAYDGVSKDPFVRVDEDLNDEMLRIQESIEAKK